VPRLPVAFVWHFHQPSYVDFFSGQILLPWVRLHGIKDYTGFALLLREFPGLKMTFNFTPSLLEQVAIYGSGGTDVYQDLLTLDVTSILGKEEEFLLRVGFNAHPHRMIGRHPRYAELKAMRDAGRYFTVPDLQDLIAWSNLVWFHPLVQRDHREIYALIQKGSRYTDQDRRTIRDTQLELLRRLGPGWSALQDSGQVELTTTPFFHPIVPLLTDASDSRHTHDPIPMSWGPEMAEDAPAQMEAGLDMARSFFGRRPRGVWPSEMSVSDRALEIFGRCGVEWIVADEDVLGCTRALNLARDGDGIPRDGHGLYQPHELGGVRIFFRDKVLSNLLGFTYQSWAPERAADDFILKLEAMSGRLPEGSVVTIALDGENPWEHYPDNGIGFLSALCWKLSRSDRVACVTPSEVRGPRIRLDRIHAGSWINANFDVWSGDEEDRRAWTVLRDVRTELFRARDRVDPARWSNALHSLHAAEGSDWFWWYGPEFDTTLALEYDALFRRHLMNSMKLAGLPVPDSLHRPIKRRVHEPHYPIPTAALQPQIDGRVTTYFEWQSAGRYGVVHDLDYYFSRRSPFSEIWFGSDERNLYLRLDLLAGGPSARSMALVLWPEGALAPIDERATVRSDQIVEVALPLSLVKLGPGQPLAFQLQIETDRETLRLPMAFPLRFTLSDPAAKPWQA
jgi:alpha-amylase/alpha-mannosidase (GH57 family)